MANYLVLFVDKNGTGITGKELSGEIPYYTSKLVFYNSGLDFRSDWDSLEYISWDDTYQGTGISTILCNRSSVSDGEEVDYNGGDIEVMVCYEYTPPANPGGGDNPPDNKDEDENQEDTTTQEIPIQFSFTVKHCKSGTATSIDGTTDEVVSQCYYLTRYDEGTIGDYGLLNLKYYTDYEFDGEKYIYTDEQTYTVPSTITGYKLDSFHGIENGKSIIGEKDGINEYTLYAYYIDNDFTVTIDAKGIDSTQVTVQNPNTELKYELPYTATYHNQTLLLEALTNNAEYEFDYWEVNGTKIYSSRLSYEIESDLQIYCCFKEKMSPGEVEDDKIATNEDIHTIIENSSLYPITDDENSNYLSYRCPTKYNILNNNYTTGDVSTNAGQLINISGTYTDDQCVKLEDISFDKRKIQIGLYNDYTYGVDALGSTIVTFYASENTLNSISTDDIELTSINISDYADQTGGRFDHGDSIYVEYTLPNYNIFNMYIKIKIRGSYGAKNAFRTYCCNNYTINWMDQSRNELPAGTHDTVKGYSRKYNYFIKIIKNYSAPNLCVVFYDTP